jgi:hypothetical protein
VSAPEIDDMTLIPRHGMRSRPTVLAALFASAALLAGLAGCGGSGSGTHVPLPPGGVAIGNLVCVNTTVVPATNALAQGGSLTITFHLVDVNSAVPGAGLPVSFDVIGGSVGNPPTHTDATGAVTVVYTASPTYLGNGRVRLIQPDAQLDCDVSFSIFMPTCILTSQTLDGADAVVTDFDACGSLEPNVERQMVRKIRYQVVAPNPLTNVLEPVVGARFRLTATGMNFTTMEVGPTDATGHFTQTVTPFATGVGTASVTAEVIRQDLTGPNGVPDGVPDSLACNTCKVSFGIINPICDANGFVPVPTYRDANGAVKASPLRPGESADVTALYVVDGTPLSGYPVLVSSASGFVNGSAAPIHMNTQPDGSVTVTYTAPDGFTGDDTVTFQSDRGDVTCTQVATIHVVTCDITVQFATPPQSGMDSVVTVTVLNADPATAAGQLIALDVVGGYFSAQPPYYPLDANLQVTTTLHVTPGFSGPSTFSVSFPGGYPCTTVSKPFTVLP